MNGADITSHAWARQLHSGPRRLLLPVPHVTCCWPAPHAPGFLRSSLACSIALAQIVPGVRKACPGKGPMFAICVCVAGR